MSSDSPSIPRVMKALVLHSVGDLRFETVPTPTPGPGQVLIRVSWCGVCGSDFPRIYRTGAHRHPLICGHELAGIVVARGPGVRGVRTGERVAVFPLIWCDQCPACERGVYAQCSDYDYLGSRSDGGFAEYVVSPARNLIPVPDTVSMEAAAMTEPAAVALHALRRGGSTDAGETVAIIGGGAIGLLTALWAREHGAGQVLVFDIDRNKIELARRLGFAQVFDARKEPPADVLSALTDGDGAHLVIEAAGVPATTLQAIEAARRGGRVVLLGNPSATVHLPPSLISRVLRRELSIRGTWNSVYSATGADDDWHTAIETMNHGGFDPVPLVTHRLTLQDAPPILERVRNRTEFSARILIGSG